MVRIEVGEVAVPESRFPCVYLTLDGKSVVLRGGDATRLGRALVETDRGTVQAVHEAAKVFTCDADELP